MLLRAMSGERKRGNWKEKSLAIFTPRDAARNQQQLPQGLSMPTLQRINPATLPCEYIRLEKKNCSREKKKIIPSLPHFSPVMINETKRYRDCATARQLICIINPRWHQTWKLRINEKPRWTEKIVTIANRRRFLKQFFAFVTRERRKEQTLSTRKPLIERGPKVKARRESDLQV